LSKVDGTYLKELEKLTKMELLILDDFGLQAFDNQDREALMDKRKCPLKTIFP
jgi:DNA replication protein DnaC